MLLALLLMTAPTDKSWLELAKKSLPANEQQKPAVMRQLKRAGADKGALTLLSKPGAPVADLRVAFLVIRTLKPKGAAAVVTPMLGHPSVEIRRDAALALAVLGPTLAEAELIKALEDEDRFVRDYAVQALRLIPTKMVRDAMRARLSREEDELVLEDLKAALAAPL
jgi:HEAT repeat protein